MTAKFLPLFKRVKLYIKEANDLRLIRSSDLFDRDWYLKNNPDVAEVKVDPVSHYLRHGGYEGRDPGPNFSSKWYLDTYEDVKRGGTNPLVHYLRYGRKEGRTIQPDQADENLALIKSSGLFDEDWYLASNPDIANAKVDPASHYLHHGGFEGRDPSSNFSSKWYLNTYIDVKSAGINPLIHYLRYGRKKGYIAQPQSAAMTRSELERYFRDDLQWGWGYQARLVFSFLCQAAEAAQGGVVLDAGAGHQRYKPFFQGCLYVAQEHPEAGKQNKNLINYDILCDVRTIPLHAECIDVVLSTSSFEHMEYPQEFVNEAFRVLKPGGSLWIQVPFVYHEHEVPYDFQRDTRYGLMRHYRHAGFSSYWVKPDTSSTEAGIFALKYGIEEDMRRLNVPFHIRAIARFLSKFTDVYLKLIAKMFDRGPYDNTTMSVGWISSATKAGELQQADRGDMSAKEFVSKNAL